MTTGVCAVIRWGDNDVSLYYFFIALLEFKLNCVVYKEGSLSCINCGVWILQSANNRCLHYNAMFL